MVNPQTGTPPYSNTTQPNQPSILSAFGLGGQEMSQQPMGYDQPPMGYGQQPPSMFGSFFSSTGKINPQSIRTIQSQLEQQGVSPVEIAKIINALNEMQYARDEQVNTILTNILGPELAQKVQLKAELEELEDDSSSMRRPGLQGVRQPVRQGFSRRAGQYGESYGGKRRHRTRGRKQRGGYSMSTFSNDAAPITGGRRKSRRHRRRTHKKHGKRSHRR